MSAEGSMQIRRLAKVVEKHYIHEVQSIVRIRRGMATANWRIRTSRGDFFLKQYLSRTAAAREALALALSEFARAGGVPTPAVIPSNTGELLVSEGDLALALFEYVPGTTSGVPLSRSEMTQAGHTLGRLHERLRGQSGMGDVSAKWRVLDLQRKRATFNRFLSVIECKKQQDAFDRRTVDFVRQRLALLPRAAALLESLPPLASQVLHGDYSVSNILYRRGELVAVVDFGPPELFLPAFEIGRAALNPETVTADTGWREKAAAFVNAYCQANPEIGLCDVQFAPYVWAIQLIRSDYGPRQHYFDPVEYQCDLDRFWFQRCETADLILDQLDRLSECFVSIWKRRIT